MGGQHRALLAQAHETIAGLTTGDAQLGHLCAAGQAYARSRDWDAAERVLRQALRAAPDDRYIVTLLDGVLREGGRPEDVVSLARERSRSESSAALGELSLLLAGSNRRAQRQSDRRPACLRAGALGSARLTLCRTRLARRRAPPGRHAREAAGLCSPLGADLGGGVPELYALLRGDALSPLATADAAEAYERALEHPATALAAAVALLSTPTRLTTADQRSAAEEALADASPPEHADGFGAAYGALRASLGDEGASASDAWLQLAALAPTDGLRAGVSSQGLRAERIAQGAGADGRALHACPRGRRPGAGSPRRRDRDRRSAGARRRRGVPRQRARAKAAPQRSGRTGSARRRVLPRARRSRPGRRSGRAAQQRGR